MAKEKEMFAFTRVELKNILAALDSFIHTEINCAGAVSPKYIKLNRKICSMLGVEERG